LTNAYNEELNSNRDLDDDVEIDDDDDEVTTHDDDDDEVTTDENGDIIENLDGPNENNFEANNFGDDEWMRHLQQAEGVMGHGEASLNSPQQQQHQFRLTYEQNMPLSIPPVPVKNNNIISSSQHNDGVEVSKQETGQMRLQEPQDNHPQQILMHPIQNLDGLQQLQGADNMAALNSLLQQQQQQQHHQHHSLPNNVNQATNASLGTMQTLEQQIAALQQQQQHQRQSQNGQHHPQQLATQNLQESLLQLQKLQEQQQQIIKNISHTGLITPNNLLNPLGTLLNTLITQINGGNNNSNNSNSNNGIGDNIINNNNNNSNTINNAMNLSQNHNGTLAWGQMGSTQQMPLTNNSLLNQAGMMPNVLPQILQQQQQSHQQVGFAGANGASRESQQLQQNTCDKPQQRSGSNNSLKKSNPHFDTNTNINIEFPPPPIISKAENNNKKQRPKSFPTQLWDAMMTEGPSNDAAFEWLPDGKSFVVVNSEFFCKEILDRKFKQSKYGSFVRKLHRWGFIRLTSGTGTDCFHHPLFQRSRPELVTQIKCNSRNGKDGKKGHNTCARGEIQDSVQPSLMGVEKFIRAKVVSTESEDVLTM